MLLCDSAIIRVTPLIYSLSSLLSYVTLYDFICMTLVLLSIKDTSKDVFVKCGKGIGFRFYKKDTLKNSFAEVMPLSTQELITAVQPVKLLLML